jgi:hypothetical protein
MVARVQNRQNHQIRKCEEQALGLLARGLGRCFSCARQETQMAAARKFAQVFQPDSGEDGYFVFRKELLTGSDFNHVWLPPT